jgi:hypothetical protein
MYGKGSRGASERKKKKRGIIQAGKRLLDLGEIRSTTVDSGR